MSVVIFLAKFIRAVDLDHLFCLFELRVIHWTDNVDFRSFSLVSFEF